MNDRQQPEGGPGIRRIGEPVADALQVLDGARDAAEPHQRRGGADQVRALRSRRIAGTHFLEAADGFVVHPSSPGSVGGSVESLWRDARTERFSSDAVQLSDCCRRASGA